jgi:hypothetical protein
MWLFKQSSSAARAALIYITAGAIVVMWTIVWYVYLHNNPAETNTALYWATGFLMTGLTMILIGIGLCGIARSAQNAELPPQTIPVAVMNPKQNGAVPALVAAPAPRQV